MNKIKSFLGINFWNGNATELLKSADAQGGLFTVPSAPSLAQMRTDPALMTAYQASDWAVVDGGYVALILRFCLGRNLPRISGLQVLQRLVGDKHKRAIPFHERKILWVVPNEMEKERIDVFLTKEGFPKESQQWYLAPFYRTAADFQDAALVSMVASSNPDWIVLCIAGGKQEKVGHFLRSRIHALPAKPAMTSRPNGPVILCTGGAIAFLSGGQVSIPTWADRLYLGWFLRVCQSPRLFLPRYWMAAYEFPRLLLEQREMLFESSKANRKAKKPAVVVSAPKVPVEQSERKEVEVASGR